jgi:hypothetical protein
MLAVRPTELGLISPARPFHDPACSCQCVHFQQVDASLDYMNNSAPWDEKESEISCYGQARAKRDRTSNGGDILQAGICCVVCHQSGFSVPRAPSDERRDASLFT